jgi:hypothetical protein
VTDANKAPRTVPAATYDCNRAGREACRACSISNTEGWAFRPNWV